MSYPTMLGFIMKRPWLTKLMAPMASWYKQAAGYRQLGLKADDLIPEENETVLLALKRLPPKEAYDRIFRLRRAFQLSIAHSLLPKDQWTKPDEDNLYLTPLIKEIEAEKAEREDLDVMVPKKPATPN